MLTKKCVEFVLGAEGKPTVSQDAFNKRAEFKANVKIRQTLNAAI